MEPEIRIYPVHSNTGTCNFRATPDDECPWDATMYLECVPLCDRHAEEVMSQLCDREVHIERGTK
jgi:hypothetical protein